MLRRRPSLKVTVALLAAMVLGPVLFTSTQPLEARTTLSADPFPVGTHSHARPTFAAAVNAGLQGGFEGAIAGSIGLPEGVVLGFLVGTATRFLSYSLFNGIVNVGRVPDGYFDRADRPVRLPRPE